ncbi:hypothetical protein [Rhodobacter sp. NSM]|uniref:hypothetical protein n=1 Tax=Rhodobacter sp. NSM TaxID=3457501 RepID=UPI003FD4827B
MADAEHAAPRKAGLTVGVVSNLILEAAAAAGVFLDRFKADCPVFIEFRAMVVIACMTATSACAGGEKLSCSGPAGSEVQVQRLCTILQQTVREREGLFLDTGTFPAGEALIELKVLRADARAISAQVSRKVPGGSRSSPVLDLSITDRDSFPDSILSRFAESLLAHVKAE